MAFSTIGHTDAKRLLLQSRKAGRMAHAYLITGVASIGRSTLALDIARLLNCTADRDAEDAPCGACVACAAIQAGKDAVDIHHIGLPQSGTTQHKNISIDQIHDLIRMAMLKPYSLACRVFIIDAAEKMSVAASNALLKVLEEPPADAKLILSASSVSALPETVASRCTVLRLSPHSDSTVREALSTLPEAAELDAAQLDTIVKLSAGRIGNALRFAKNPILMEAHEQSIARCAEFYHADLAGKLRFAEELSFQWRKQRQEVLSELERWLMWWRDVARAQLGEGAKSAEQKESTEQPAAAPPLPKVSLSQAVTNWQAVQEASLSLHQNVSARLALEIMALKFIASEQPTAH